MKVYTEVVVMGQKKISLKQYEGPEPCILIIYNQTDQKIALDSPINRVPSTYIYGCRRPIKFLYSGSEWVGL